MFKMHVQAIGLCTFQTDCVDMCRQMQDTDDTDVGNVFMQAHFMLCGICLKIYLSQKSQFMKLTNCLTYPRVLCNKIIGIQFRWLCAVCLVNEGRFKVLRKALCERHYTNETDREREGWAQRGWGVRFLHTWYIYSFCFYFTLLIFLVNRNLKWKEF